MTWGPIGRIKPTTVTVELDWDSVEFIAMELPQRDGFTRDWWSDIYKPMLALREEQENVECPTCDGEGYVWDDEDGGSYDCHDCTPENVEEPT